MVYLTDFLQQGFSVLQRLVFSKEGDTAERKLTAMHAADVLGCLRLVRSASPNPIPVPRALIQPLRRSSPRSPTRFPIRKFRLLSEPAGRH